MVIEKMLGRVCSSVKNSDDEILFTFADGGSVAMHHYYECCESVYVESVVGDLDDLIGEPLLVCEENTEDVPDYEYGVGMWTFYKFATRKGYVDIRWYGCSNGYYGVGVTLDFKDVKNA